MNETHDSVVSRESQGKFAQTHVTAVEKYYGLLCETLGSVIRKSARLRDKSDIFAHQLKEYAVNEKLNNSTRTSLLSFAENLSTIQDYRNTEVQRLEAKVLQPLMKYGVLCKNMKRCIKDSESAWTREKKQSEKLRKMQQKLPASTPQVAKAQADLQKMKKQVAQNEEQLLTEVDHFEKNKLADMKSVLSEFVQIEMLFHARALEYFSRCYEAAQRIETTTDMDLFRATLFGASGLPQTFSQTAASNYQLLTQGTSSSHHTTPQPRIQRRMYDDEDDSEEEDDDYGDEDS